MAGHGSCLRRRAGTLLLGLAGAWLSACAGLPVHDPPPTAQAALPPPPAHPNGQLLWTLIHDRCVPGERERGDPAPCALVSLAGGEAAGFGLLKDRNGVSQYLLMPTARITGIEDQATRAAGATNYFAWAWALRGVTEARLGRPVAPDGLAVAVNSIYGRTQDQLHLHIDCLSQAARTALAADARQVGATWSRGTYVLAGHPYFLRRIAAGALDRTNPFGLLAASAPGAAADMGAWTLVLTGAPAGDRRGGFLLAAGRADPSHGNDGSGEELQDHGCGAGSSQ